MIYPRLLFFSLLLLFFCSGIFFCSGLFAQSENYTSEKITLSWRYTNLNFNCAGRDGLGFMWFGSSLGLHRYDGEEFKLYPFDPGHEGSISGEVIGIQVQGDSIWLATDHGVDCMDLLTGTIEKHIPVPIFFPKDHTFTYSYMDRNGNIWTTSWEVGLAKFHTDSQVFTEYSPYFKDTQDTAHIHLVTLDENGNLWLAYRPNGFGCFDTLTKDIHWMASCPYPISDLFIDHLDRIWIASTRGLYLFNKLENRYEHPEIDHAPPDFLEDQDIRQVVPGQNHSIWLASTKGIYKISSDLDLLFSWEFPLEVAGMLHKFGDALKLYVDPEGIVWCMIPGSIYKLYKVRSSAVFINPFTPALANISGLMVINNDSLIFGINDFDSLDHLCFFNRRTGDLKLLNIPQICEIFRDSKGMLWIGTWKGLYKQTGPPGSLAGYKKYVLNPGDSTGLQGDEIRHIYEDRSGRVWIGTNCGTPCFFDRKKDRFIHLVDGSGKDLDFRRMKIRFETEQGSLYGYSCGAYLLVPPFRRISEHAVSADNVQELVSPLCFSDNNPVYSIRSELDSRGNLWLGDFSLGLCKLDTAGQITHYTSGDGLPNNKINSIIEDVNGDIWIGTSRGLSRIDGKNGTMVSYFSEEDVPFSVGQFSAKNRNGELFFSTWDNGILSFHPDSIQKNPRPPEVVISELRINNQDVFPGESNILDKSILHTREIILTYDQNTITLGLSVLNFIQSDRNQQKYMMEGVDKSWVYGERLNTMTYSNLQPGNYIFRASGSNNDGIWNEEGTSLSITVLPPPWLRWWAYMCYLLFLAGIIMLIWRYLVNRAKMKATLLEERIEIEKAHELDHMKSRFFANISHEFRTPLTLLLGPIEDKLKSRQKLDHDDRGIFRIMHRNAKRLQRLINQLLDLSKLEFGKAQLQASEGDISGFSKSLAQSFLSLAESRNIVYRIHIPKHPVQAYFDPDILEKILINLISNAFKFTPEKGSVSVSMHLRQDETTNKQTHTEFIIKDTGKGIPPEQFEKIFERFYQVSSSDSREFEGTGIGLALCRELANMHHGNIKVKSAPGKGSTFTVVLPCSREYFTEDELAAGKVTIPEFDEFISDDERDEFVESSIDKSIIQEDTPVLMIVEDNADLRRYISQNLEDQFQICEAVNGRDGLSKTIEIIPDLVITDLMMPVMDGIEMCSKIKDDDRTSHIPVIIITAKADRESKIEGLETGADDYLIKPFDAEELQIRVRNMIEHKNKIREQLYKEFIFGEIGIEVKGSDKRFLQQTTDHIQNHIGDPEFNVQNLVSHMGISQMQLYRKLRGSANMTPGELIRNTRLKSSLILLKQGHENISQIAYQVGFSDHSHYSKCFRELFGMSPKEYTKGRKKDPSGRNSASNPSHHS